MAIESLYEAAEDHEDDAPAALEFQDVFRIYRSGDVETVALRGLSLRIEPGEAVAVAGPSGSGKSTFLHLAAGLDVASAGDIRIQGRSLPRLGEDELAAYRARQVAIVFQRDNLWPGLTAKENVESCVRLAGESAASGRAVEALRALGLEHRLHHRVGALSGGEAQRVAIAAAAARRSRLVLADEPTGELDVANEQVVLEALLRLRSDFGSTVVVVTHSARVTDVADRVIEIRDGRTAA
jgi:putative ABC transport system ATP-binding protein